MTLESQQLRVADAGWKSGAGADAKAVIRSLFMPDAAETGYSIGV